MDSRETSVDGGGWLVVLPAWFLSLAVHLLLAVAGCWLLGVAAPEADDDKGVRPGEIVLARRDAHATVYFNDDESDKLPHRALKPIASGASTPGSPAVQSTELAAAASPPPLVPGIGLPESASGASEGQRYLAGYEPGARQGKVRLPTSALDEAAILAEDALIPREQRPTGPTAPLSLFGSPSAVGRSFVFVIDRSNSMGGQGLGALQAAAKELAAQIDRLSADQTVQVVAYNQATLFLTDRELIPATDENKQKLVQFVANLPAFGQTEHWRGLATALRLKPEVIFLLTDGGDPVLHAGQLRQIREEAAGRTSIHCLHFGRGEPSAEPNFLMRLATDNGGSYVYIDMNRH